MSLLQELNTLLSPIVPVETGVFSESAPNRYVVITPLADTFALYTDDSPRHETQEARLSLFDKGSYTATKPNCTRSAERGIHHNRSPVYRARGRYRLSPLRHRRGENL